jgi:hypothetical protein
LPEFIEELYFKHFKRSRPDSVRSIEQMVRDYRRKNRSEKYGESKERIHIHPVREKSSNSNGSVFSLHCVPSFRLTFFYGPPPDSRQNPGPPVMDFAGL